MTTASLGVTGAVTGGSYLSNNLQNNPDNLQVLSDPSAQNGIGARAGALAKAKQDKAESDKQEQQRKSVASRSGRGSVATEEAERTATPQETVDQLASSSNESVIDRTAVQRRRAEERASRARERMMSGDPRQIAQALLSERGWDSEQFGCLEALWDKESGWNPSATNPSSGAYGIPQSLPGSKMAMFGDDWRTNPSTQIKWGLWYISGRYGTPCGAWAHSQSTGWY